MPTRPPGKVRSKMSDDLKGSRWVFDPSDSFPHIVARHPHGGLAGRPLALPPLGQRPTGG